MIIDPGHGGFDHGAVHAGVHEADIVLQISKKLKKRLEKSREFQPILLRKNKNSELALSQRVRLGQQNRGDLFLSIHANANPDSKVRGREFYIQNQLAPEEEVRFIALRENQSTSQAQNGDRSVVEDILFDLKDHQKVLESYALSQSLKRRWPSKIKKKHPVRQGPFYVLGQNSIPSVLLEVGYLTNKKDRRQLKSSKFQEQMVEKIYQGLKDYWLSRDKEQPKTL